MRPSLVPHFEEESHQGAGSGDAPHEKGNPWYFWMKAYIGIDSCGDIDNVCPDAGSESAVVSMPYEQVPEPADALC